MKFSSFLNPYVLLAYSEACCVSFENGAVDHGVLNKTESLDSESGFDISQFAQLRFLN